MMASLKNSDQKINLALGNQWPRTFYIILPGILRSENMWPWQEIMNMFAPFSTALSFVFRGNSVSIKNTPKTRVRCKSVWEIQNSTLSSAWSGMGNDL